MLKKIKRSLATTYNVEKYSVARPVQLFRPGVASDAAESSLSRAFPRDGRSTRNRRRETLAESLAGYTRALYLKDRGGGCLLTDQTVLDLQGLVAAHHVLPMTGDSLAHKKQGSCRNIRPHVKWCRKKNQTIWLLMSIIVFVYNSKEELACYYMIQ